MDNNSSNTNTVILVIIVIVVLIGGFALWYRGANNPADNGNGINVDLNLPGGTSGGTVETGGTGGSATQ
ncbi:MAG: hypothetical protein Q7R88_02530 [bacterium]|nr:hypothetical protein [bacterium]